MSRDVGGAEMLVMCCQGCWHAGNVCPNAKTVRGSVKMLVMCVQMPKLFDCTFDAGNACPNAKVSAECKDAGNVCPNTRHAPPVDTPHKWTRLTSGHASHIATTPLTFLK